MKKILLFSLIVVLFFSCGKKNGTFSVEGKIENAEGKMLKVIHQTLTKDIPIDSVKLDKTGKFKFKVESPKYPDFYLLKVEDKKVILAVDSIEKILVSAKYPNFLEAKIANSIQSIQIQKYRQKVIELSRQLSEYKMEKDSKVKKKLLDTLTLNLEKHKKVVRNSILTNSNYLSCYFALYQQIKGKYIFSVYDKEDLPYYRTLATLMDNEMPEYERSKNMHQLVLGAIQQFRLERNRQYLLSQQNSQKTGFIDIKLKDKNGYFKKLSEYIGQPIILDFTVYGEKKLLSHTFDIQELYQKYKDKGVVVYQVCFNPNVEVWEQVVSNKPWIAVNDVKGYYSRLYNVPTFPTTFLIDKGGNLTKRYQNLNDVEKDLKKILKN